MDALRAVRPPKPWLAGSPLSYASTSTIRPPTPSTSSVAPTSAGAPSWAPRAKSSAGGARGVHQPERAGAAVEPVERERREERARHSEHHRVRVRQEHPEQHLAATDEAEAFLDGLPARALCIVRR